MKDAKFRYDSAKLENDLRGPYVFLSSFVLSFTRQLGSVQRLLRFYSMIFSLDLEPS